MGKWITYFNKFNAREQKLFSRNDMKPTRMANRNIYRIYHISACIPQFDMWQKLIFMQQNNNNQVLRA